MNRDRLTKARRSWNMSRIRGKNTTPEMRVRSLLHRLGYRFRLHVRIPIFDTLSASTDLPRSRERERAVADRVRVVRGKTLSVERDRVRCRTPRAVSADVLLPKYKTVIFVHGCFWHRHRGCKNCTTPTNRRKWWLAKLEGNAVRDKLHQRALRKLGWRSVVVWECQTEKLKSLEKFARGLRLGGASRAGRIL